MDTLVIVVHFILDTIGMKSPRAAVLNVAEFRFRDIDDQAEEGSLDTLQKNTPFRLIVFVLGALPQVIKLYAMSGVSMKQLWGSLFLSSFVVHELMVRMPRENWQESREIYNQINTGSIDLINTLAENNFLIAAFYASYVALAVDAFMVISLQMTGIEDGYRVKMQPQDLVLLSLSALSVVGYALSVYKKSENYLSIALVLLSPITLVTSIALWFVNFLGFRPVQRLIFGGVAPLAFLMTIAIIIWFREHLSRKKAGYLELGLQMYFVLIDFLGALLGYQMCFHSGDTWKPSWTNVQG